MRKRYRTKRRSCMLCKPQKLGASPRWTGPELALLKEFEREQREARC